MPDPTAPASTPPLALPDPAAADAWPAEGSADAAWDDTGGDVWPTATPRDAIWAPPAETAPFQPAEAPSTALPPADPAVLSTPPPPAPAPEPPDSLGAALASLLAISAGLPSVTPPAALPPATGGAVAETAHRLGRHVAARWTLRDGGCPMCGGAAWTPSLYATVILAATPAPDATPVGSFPAAVLTCTGCGFVAVLNLAAAGIVPGAPPAAAPSPSVA